jgi:hypothetical protein
LAGNSVVFGFDRDARGSDALNASSHNKRKMEKAGKIGRNGTTGRDAERAPPRPTRPPRNDQKTESTLARFVGRFEILAGEKRFDRCEGGVGNVAFDVGKERIDRRVSFVFFKEKFE